MNTPVPDPPAADPSPSQSDATGEQGLEETYVPGEADTGTEGLARMADADPESESGPAAASSKAKASARKSKASELGDFKLLKKLGEGGMGEVYLARQQGLDRNVALKVLSKQLGKKEAFVERFFREARAMARLDHPNVLKVYAVETDKGRH